VGDELEYADEVTLGEVYCSVWKIIQNN
jgi:hypothetical protein